MTYCDAVHNIHVICMVKMFTLYAQTLFKNVVYVDSLCMVKELMQCLLLCRTVSECHAGWLLGDPGRTELGSNRHSRSIKQSR